MHFFGQNSNHKLEEIKDGGGGAPPPAVQPPPAAAPAVEPKAVEQPKPAASDKTPEEKGSPADFYNKPVSQEGDPKSPGDKKPDVKPDEKKIEPATGYGKEPIKVEEEVAKPAEVVKPDEKVELGYDLKLEGLEKDQVKSIQEFAKKHSLSQAAAQEIVDNNIANNKVAIQNAEEQQKLQKRQVQEMRAKWDKELRTDPVFGGENFDANVQRAERVYDEFMSETKKELTKHGVTVPAYVMRDLAKLADVLYRTEKPVHGNPIVEAPVEKEKSPLDFYNQSQSKS